MSDTTGSPVARALIIGLLAAATLGFGLAGLCGAAFTIVSVPDLFNARANSYAGAALVFSVPSLLIGGGLAWLFGRALRKQLRNKP